MNEKPGQVNLLIVEDDELDTRILRSGLLRIKSQQLKIFHAIDGQVALDMLSAGDSHTQILASPVIAIVDINLPRMNGIELIRCIRANKKLSPMEIFILSTSSSEYEIREAYELHVGGFFVKAKAGPLYREFIEMLKQYLAIVSLR